MLIAHDLGTSGNKASLHDERGRLLAEATVGYQTHYAADTTSEQNPNDWWSAVVSATKELLGKTQIPPASVAGICVSGQMMGLVCLDAAGVPVRPAMIWSDQRATEQAAALASAVPDAFAITGHRVAPTYTLPKLMWVRDHDPRAFEATRAVCVAKDYVNLKLTGRLVTDHSDASSTDAYDLATGRWSATLLDAAGVDAALWPEIVDSTHVIGPLTAQAASELGLTTSTLVVAGGGDGPIANVGAACVNPDAPGYVSLGTSAWYSRTLDAPRHDPQRRSFTFRHVVPGLFAPCATSQSGAGSVQWFAETLGREDAVGELLDRASDAVAADDDLYFLPYLIGERTPWWDAAASGVFVGLRKHHGGANLMRAVMEGVGFNLGLCVDSIELGNAPESITVIGGGAGNDTWLQVLADAWGTRVVRRSVTSQANSLGAAVTGLVGLGLADFSLAEELSAVTAEFVPGPEAERRRVQARRFVAAYHSLAGWFADADGGRAL